MYSVGIDAIERGQMEAGTAAACTVAPVSKMVFYLRVDVPNQSCLRATRKNALVLFIELHIFGLH